MSKYLKHLRHIPLDSDDAREIQEQLQAIIDEASEPGEMLRELRAQKGLTPKELGEKIGVDPENIAKMEEGEIPIDEKTAQRLGKLFKIDFKAFFFSE